MYKKVVTYEDYEGNQRTEELYFNLSKAEIIELEMSTENGFFSKDVDRMLKSKKSNEIFSFFTDLIKRSYGVKSIDGKRFIKSKEVLDDFLQSEAYSELLVNMFNDTNSLVDFFTGLFPKEIANALRENKDEITAKAKELGYEVPDIIVTTKD